MKVILIMPPGVCHISEVPGAGYPPLGLAYIASVLEKERYEVHIIDASLGGELYLQNNNTLRFGLSSKEIRQRIIDFSPNVVGISGSSTATITFAHEIAKISKEVLPKVPVIFGGTHSTSAPDEILQDRNVDAVVLGEGELTFLEVVRRVEKREPFFDVEGTVVRYNGNIVRNPERPRIENLDELPFPARHLLPPIAEYNKNILKNDFFMRKPIAPMITSRGCAIGCCFCAYSKVFQRTWRARSAKSVVDEMEYLVKHFKVREIHFLDDNINLNRNRMFDICNEIIKRKLNVKWVAVSGMYLWTIDEELLRQMKRSGCYRVGFGIESGNSDTIKFIGKRFDRQRIIEIYKIANRIGLWTQACFVIGFPYEKLESMRDTLKLALDCQSNISVFNIATPYPGTRLHEIFVAEGLLPKNKYLSQLIGGCDTKYFKANEIKSIADNYFGIFFSTRMKQLLKNPFSLLPKVKCFEEIKYTLKIADRFLIIFFNRIKFGNYSFTGLRR